MHLGLIDYSNKMIFNKRHIFRVILTPHKIKNLGYFEDLLLAKAMIFERIEYI